ncbi:hypothetical protein HPC62_21915 [Thermoleptolyngbya sichuanensis A183]|uniref:Uma2 family endonuclease n=1 Tax=Thermoleptolyngbya sichuanensis A183 TaxID=2737172 RepID=A0A6M8BCQ3_9CYAN|nr:hypothetical protein [Thermoleptolyngbya sichuanensis]MDG2617250.1 hypothetical protein [Thermoleptolyngbya sichuanensis XZ-Cy5]QKD84488.1 hypothetical protein HPC62_21915 [Thermoleptolyngbya sichuanensis A183]
MLWHFTGYKDCGSSVTGGQRVGAIALTQEQLQQVQQQAEAERERAESKRERAEKLAERLRSLGIDPNAL